MDYLFLLKKNRNQKRELLGFNPYFIGLPILIEDAPEDGSDDTGSFNPYFIGLPILIMKMKYNLGGFEMFQSLFYWITYSYPMHHYYFNNCTIVSILILLDYLFLYGPILKRRQ